MSGRSEGIWSQKAYRIAHKKLKRQNAGTMAAVLARVTKHPRGTSKKALAKARLLAQVKWATDRYENAANPEFDANERAARDRQDRDIEAARARYARTVGR